MSFAASTNSLWLLSLTSVHRLKSITIELLVLRIFIHQCILLGLIWHITFTLVILSLKITRLIHFFLNTLICIKALLRLLLLILYILNIQFLHTSHKLIILLVDRACLILIYISISRQNTTSLTMLNLNLPTITILIANDLFNLPIFHISSLSLRSFLSNSLNGCDNLIRIFVLNHLF